MGKRNILVGSIVFCIMGFFVASCALVYENSARLNLRFTLPPLLENLSSNSKALAAETDQIDVYVTGDGMSPMHLSDSNPKIAADGSRYFSFALTLSYGKVLFTVEARVSGVIVSHGEKTVIIGADSPTITIPLRPDSATTVNTDTIGMALTAYRTNFFTIPAGTPGYYRVQSVGADICAYSSSGAKIATANETLDFQMPASGDAYVSVYPPSYATTPSANLYWPLPTPVFAVVSGNFHSDVQTSIVSPYPGTYEIRYTTDGSEPGPGQGTSVASATQFSCPYGSTIRACFVQGTRPGSRTADLSHTDSIISTSPNTGSGFYSASLAVDLTFSRDVGACTISTANILISGSGSNGYSITSLLLSGTSCSFTLSGYAGDGPIAISISGMLDPSSNVIPAFSAVNVESVRNLYVSTTGSDTAFGNKASPKRTIQSAMTMAVAPTTVYVSAGVYNQTSLPVIVRDGISLSGGWDASFATYNPSVNVTEIRDQRPSGNTVMFDTPITLPTTLEGFTITMNDKGGNSAAVVSFTDGEPVIRDNIIVGGTGYQTRGIDFRPNSIASPKIYHNVIYAGDANANNTYGIYIGGLSSPIIAFNVIRGGTAQFVTYTIDFDLKGNSSCQPYVVNNVLEAGASIASSNCALAYDFGVRVQNNIFLARSGVCPNHPVIDDIRSTQAYTLTRNLFYATSTWNDFYRYNGIYVLNFSTAAPTLDGTNANLGGAPRLNLQINPLFINLAANDFRLQPASPAQGAGTNLYGQFSTWLIPTDDLAGIALSSTGTWPIGPYQ